MRLGNRCGCHQREDRSFHIKGWQFPICSRCTGILVGQLLGILIYIFQFRIPIYISCIFLFIMFLDWYIQYKKILHLLFYFQIKLNQHLFLIQLQFYY